jgi:hypothetical protein
VAEPDLWGRLVTRSYKPGPKLIALSRAEIERLAPALADSEPSVAICIAYPTGRLHKVEPGGSLMAVHHTRFSDCDGDGRWTFPENKDHAKPIPMTRGQAIDVLDFAERWMGQVETIYAACYGGVSRSRGVLAGLAAIYGWDDRELYAKGHPNAWCKTLLLRERWTP